MGVILRLGDCVNEDEDNVGVIPLVGYAARHWVEHAWFENVCSRIRNAMEYFFDADKPHWAPWCQVQDIDVLWDLFTPNEGLNHALPLYYASLGGFYKLAEHLVGKHPEQIKTRGGRLVTPLVAALRGKHLQVADLLHHHGADVNVWDSNDNTPLHLACKDGLVDIIHWLFDHDGSVNAQNKLLSTPLHVAAYNGHLQAAQMLIEHNADIHSRTGLGLSPLHAATCPRVKSNQVNIMQVLLDHGANPNARDNDNSTPLHHSSWSYRITTRRGTVDSTRLLLKHGAIIDAEDNEGRTPLQLALEHGREDIVTCLKVHGATR